MKSATILCSALNFNHNVLYTFIYKFSDGIAQGVWSLASMATYIYLLENNSTRVTCLECDCISGASMMHATTWKQLVLMQYVGLAQGIQGTFVAVSAIPGTSRPRSSTAVKVLQSFLTVAVHFTFGALLQLAG